MWWTIGTVVVVVGLGELIIRFGPEGWRTRIVMWGGALATTLAGILDQLGTVDWNKLVDSPKVAYGLAIAIPIIGARLRELTTNPPGSAP